MWKFIVASMVSKVPNRRPRTRSTKHRESELLFNNIWSLNSLVVIIHTSISTMFREQVKFPYELFCLYLYQLVVPLGNCFSRECWKKQKKRQQKEVIITDSNWCHFCGERKWWMYKQVFLRCLYREFDWPNPTLETKSKYKEKPKNKINSHQLFPFFSWCVKLLIVLYA